MATVINNPGNGGGGGDSGVGIIVGVLIALLLIGLFIIYGVPALRGGGGDSIEVNVPTPEVNVSLPGGEGGGQ